MNLLETSPYLALQEKCMILLRNLAGDCAEFRDEIVYQDIV